MLPEPTAIGRTALLNFPTERRALVPVPACRCYCVLPPTGERQPCPHPQNPTKTQEPASRQWHLSLQSEYNLLFNRLIHPNAPVLSLAEPGQPASEYAARDNGGEHWVANKQCFQSSGGAVTRLSRMVTVAYPREAMRPLKIFAWPFWEPSSRDFLPTRVGMTV